MTSVRAAASPALPRSLGLMLVAQAVVTLWPFFLFQPWFMSAFCALLIAWRGVLVWQERAAPPRWIILPLALLGMGGIALYYGNPVGRLPGLAMLCLLLPLKLLETRSTRDMRSALLLNFFLMLGMFLHEQSALIAIASAAAMLMSIACAARTQRPNMSMRAALRQGASLLLVGAPLMMLLFVLFPRIDGPLWGLPIDAFGSQTGLSDHMGSHSISQLIQSGEIAFRAQFQGEPPPNSERYWRGPVLTRFDGTDWTPMRMPVTTSAEYSEAGRTRDYTVTLEANNLRWLLSLDYPTRTDTGRFTHDFGLLADTPVRKRTRYTVRSNPELIVGVNEEQWVLDYARILPYQFNPRTVAAGKEIARAQPEPEARLSAILGFMRSARLQYTLSPKPTGRDGIDDFLFTTHEGFCEHFSAAFVVLARAAGMPARVVTGYQGGELNPVDGSLVIRQSDAHAWAEIWLPQRGWIRVDPTAESFPQRIEDGLRASLPATDPLPFVVRSNINWLRELRFRWEALGNTWNQWVLGYNAQRQMELMRQLGFAKADWQLLASLMTGGAGLWLLWLIWRYLPRRVRRDALDRAWDHFCKRMARRHPAREPWETATAYAERLATQQGEQGILIRQIAEHYTRLRFGADAVRTEDIAHLRQLIRQVRS